MTTPGRVAVTRALGRPVHPGRDGTVRGGLRRRGTEQILTAYADGHEDGIAAYAEAIENSHAVPPDTDLLAWSSVMGPDERAAYDACAAAIELAVAAR